jgi:glycosyltransferase involved in cell wall biosynthesis
MIPAMPDPALTVVIPVLNEELNVAPLYQRLKGALASLDYQLLFIDDGSTDGTLDAIREIRADDDAVKFISFSRNFGHQIAVTAGLDAAKGDAVVVIDADLQDPPELIPELYAKHQEGFDVVYAVRIKRKGEGILKRLSANIFYRILRRLTGFSIPVDVGDFRLMSRRAVDAFKELRERHRYVRGMVSWLGFEQVGVEYERDARHTGETKYGFTKMLKLAIDGVTSFSYVPLQLATSLGFGVSFLSLLYVGYVVWMKIFTDRPVIGWASTMVAIMFLGGVQLITLGIVGEYIGRISDEVKRRPIYIISETEGTDP